MSGYDYYNNNPGGQYVPHQYPTADYSSYGPQDGYQQHSHNQQYYPPPQDPTYAQQPQYNPQSYGPPADPNYQNYAPPHSHSATPLPEYSSQVAPYTDHNQVQAYHTPSPVPPSGYGQYAQPGYPHDEQRGASDAYYGQQQHQQGQLYGQHQQGYAQGQQEGDRGLGATLLGGAGGAFVGHKTAGGALGTLGGMVMGAIGANVLENK